MLLKMQNWNSFEEAVFPALVQDPLLNAVFTTQLSENIIIINLSFKKEFCNFLFRRSATAVLETDTSVAALPFRAVRLRFPVMLIWGVRCSTTAGSLVEQVWISALIAVTVVL